MEEASLLGELCHRQRVLPVCTARKARGVRRDSTGTEDVSLGCLTVKLSGRVMPPDQRRERTLSSSARGAQPATRHGPLQRLLEVSPMVLRVGIKQAADHLLVRNFRSGGVALEEIHTAFAQRDGDLHTVIA